MNVDLGIRLQAYLDGELTGREAQEVSALIETQAEARALFSELEQTRTMLKGNEPELVLPETREFFWGKIEQEIAQAETVPAGQPGWLLFFRRHVRAISGAAVAAALVMFVAFQMNLVPRDLFEEIDNPLDDTGAFSFRSESQRMTLVWISNPFADAEETGEGAPMPVAEEVQ